MTAVIALVAIVALVAGFLIGRPNAVFRKDADMAAIDDLKAAVANVTAYVDKLKGDLSAGDQSDAIQAAADALNALVPAPVVEPAPVEQPDPTVEPAPTPEE